MKTLPLKGCWVKIEIEGGDIVSIPLLRKVFLKHLTLKKLKHWPLEGPEYAKLNRQYTPKPTAFGPHGRWKTHVGQLKVRKMEDVVQYKRVHRRFGVSPSFNFVLKWKATYW